MNQCKVLAAQEQKKLPPLPVPFDEQAWGEVVDWEAPMPGVYKLTTERQSGVYVADRSKGASLLPEGIFSYGIPYEGGKYVYFDYDSGRYVVEYEMSLYLSCHAPLDEKQALLDNALSAAILGAEKYAGYFGAYSPQRHTPWGTLARYIRVDDGVWFIQAGGKWALEVCCALRPELTGSVWSLAKHTANTDGALYWELEDCAPAVWELMEQRPALQGFITSTDDLQCCLCELFPQYVQQYNGDQRKERKITKKDGSSIHFLKMPV